MTFARTLSALVLAAAFASAALAADGPAAEPVQPDTTQLLGMSPEELLIRASSSALQYAPLVAPAMRLLVSEHQQSLPYLITRLDTDDVRVRIAVEETLVKIGADAVESLIVALPAEAQRTDTTRGARLAAGILGRIGDARAVDALVAIHEHPEWKVRAAVAEALGNIKDPRAVNALVALVRDDNEIARKSATVALAKIERASEGRSLDAAAERVLLSALGDPHYSVRYGAAGALGAIGEPAVASLASLAEESRGMPRFFAVLALGETGSARARKLLRSLLESPEWIVRAEAARALGKIGLDGASRNDLEGLLERGQHPFVIALTTEALSAPEE